MLKYVQFTVIGAALALGACGDDNGKGSGTNATNPSTNPTNDATEGDTSTGTSDQTSNGTTTVPGTTTAPEPTTGVATDATDSGVGTESTGSFITPPDGGGGVKECDVWTQDCPPGQKCMPWADNGSSSWNATKCSPVDANPGKEGDPCTVEGSAVSGVDTCDVGLLCWYFDENNNGSCIDMCKGTPDAPSCDMGQTCDVSNDGVLILCLETCDPLVQSCPAGQILLLGRPRPVHLRLRRQRRDGRLRRPVRVHQRVRLRPVLRHARVGARLRQRRRLLQLVLQHPGAQHLPRHGRRPGVRALVHRGHGPSGTGEHRRLRRPGVTPARGRELA
ncbi:hypothetical protein [Nannocystis pusilla]|uniref:hypothetical protein n=1 Tax=Nannocystis pusilla TaxID=889268 RepID=UPI003DA36A8E